MAPSLTKLHQINALVTGAKPRAQRTLTDAHQILQKAPVLSGISRTYLPRDDEGERLPPESTRVQVVAAKTIADMASELGRLFDLQLTQDFGNTQARADVVVDGQTVLSDVPVTYLLWLDKHLTDLRTFVDKLPTLDPSETWTWDEARACWASAPVETVRSKKVPRNHVLAEATEKHPAQVQVFNEDVPVGNWTTVKLSGALPPAQIREYRNRVAKLQDAVKVAREQANSVEVADRPAGAAILGYLFG